MSTADFSIAPVRQASPQDSPAAAAKYLEGRSGFVLEVEDRVLNGMRQQAVLSPSEEVGGVLLGRHYQHAGGSWIVVVVDHLGVPSESRSAVSFDFDKSSVQAIFSRLAAAEDDYVVGWYHSHVGGEPFMSVLDDKLHRSHFHEEWHVSCVVSAGDWGVPAGFWRFAGGKRIAVNEYSVRMTDRGTASDRHRQFLQSCNVGAADDAAQPFFSEQLQRALGLDRDGILGRTLRRHPNLATNCLDGLSGLRFLVDTAIESSNDPAVGAELAELASMMARVHSRSAVFRQVLKSARIESSLAVFGSDCYSYDVGDIFLQRFDISRRIVVPIQVTADVVSAVFAPSGRLWVLLDGRLLISAGRVSKRANILDFEFSAAKLPEEVSEPLEIAAADDALWLRSSSHWYRVPLTIEDDQIVLGEETSGTLPAGVCRFMQGWAMEPGRDHPHLVHYEGGRLALCDLVDGVWDARVSTVLPDQFHAWELVDVGLGERGCVLLFDDDVIGQLLYLDRRDLGVVWHVVSPDDDDPVEGLTADHFGRVFIQAGDTLYRM